MKLSKDTYDALLEKMDYIFARVPCGNGPKESVKSLGKFLSEASEDQLRLLYMPSQELAYCYSKLYCYINDLMNEMVIDG